MLSPTARKIAPLLLGSGFCALVYQIVWMREFRLVFGASTAASAAVLAIFVGGLGLGGLLIGGRADRHPAPLWLYGQLEALIALSSALTPALLAGVRSLYVALGGTETLGLVGGTLFRLVLAALVLAVPTVLMGGTLPAAARAVQTNSDKARTSLALLYGVNTLGAVLGAFVSTFAMIELFGNVKTLWLACLANLLVALFARQASRTLPAEPEPAPEPESESAASDAQAGAKAPLAFVVASAAVVGFAFLLMELVWYRMLGPILGGTVFTFGMILSVALLGIGAGGLVYALRRSAHTPTLRSFAHTCLLEALCLAVPFALGDRIALLALALRRLGTIWMFWGHVLGWSLICGLVVLPAAVVAGYQFPLLIALLGRGRKDVGRQAGLAYAWNTLGGILGSLAGGFGLLPLLGAPGAWRAAGLLLVVLGIAAIVLSARRAGSRARLLAPGLMAAAVLGAFMATGPTAVWRHSGIGAGRSLEFQATPNGVHDWLNLTRRSVRWEADGHESSVALAAYDYGYIFMINGKSDGGSRSDASTMIMSGLLGALLHPHPRSALVIGLGTGATAGWLGAVPSIERTDVVEIEKEVLGVARACAPINHDVLANPKVHITINDARETLMVSRRKYDLIASEPSNPYRAGIASLFTREFYRAVAERLEPDGLFLQWVQAYEIDDRTLRTMYSTLGSVYPVVETWEVGESDLLLVASQRPVRYDIPALRRRLTQEPYRSGVRFAWRATDVEGVLAHLVGSSALAHAAGAQFAPNTDDQNRAEFGFARTAGQGSRLSIQDVRNVARARHEDRPELLEGDVDWARVGSERAALFPLLRQAQEPADLSTEERALISARARQGRGDVAGSLAAWRVLGREPRTLTEVGLVAALLAEMGDEAALPVIAQLAVLQPVEANVHLARLRLRQGRVEEALTLLEGALIAFRTDPWPELRVMEGALQLTREASLRQPAALPRTLASVAQAFALEQLVEPRLALVQELVARLAPRPPCASFVASVEPHPPWNGSWLLFRSQCYAAAADERMLAASRDFERFQRDEAAVFGQDLVGAGNAKGAAPANAP